MSALIATFGADITSLRRAMAGATQLVAESAKKLVSLGAVGLKVGLGGALAGGASALAGGIKAVTSSANFERTQVAFGTLIGDAASAAASFQTAFQRLEQQSRELEAAQVDPVSGLTGEKPSPPATNPASQPPKSSHSPPKPAGQKIASSTCHSRDSHGINTVCGDETACGPTGPALEKAERRCASNWRPCGAGGSTKAAIDAAFVLPNRAGSVSRDQDQMNLRPEQSPLPATEVGEKYPSGSLVQVITDRSCVTPQNPACRSIELLAQEN